MSSRAERSKLIGLMLAATLPASVLVNGCASRSRLAPQAVVATTGPAVLTLDQIGPAPRLGTPATRNADEQPPLEAITLFARSRAAALDGKRTTAIELVEEAIKLDRSSFELYYELGRLYREGLGYDLRSIAAFERAAEIEPDRLDVQLDLGRQFLAKGDKEEALRRFRLAAQTTQYRQGDLRSAESDFLMAHTLRELGYDRAAIDRFELLLAKLEKGQIERSDEINDTLRARFYLGLGDLYLKQDRAADALRVYRKADATADGHADIDVQSRLVRATIMVGQERRGLSMAADVVRQFNASAASITLLKDIYTALGKPEAAVTALSDLHRQSPSDRPILFALCEMLAADGKTAEADDRFSVAWQRNGADAGILVRWFKLRYENDAPSSVLLLADALTEHPELAGQIDAVWRRLGSMEGRSRLHVDQISALKPPAANRAAHAYILYKVANAWPRSSLARESLDNALASRPPFAPAFFARANEILSNNRLSLQSRLTAATQLVTAAELGRDPALADTLRGQVALAKGDAAEASSCFLAASRRQSDLPEARFGIVLAMHANGDETAAVEEAWTVARLFPAYEPAYLFLNDHPDKADPDKLFATWKAAQPTGEPLNARLILEQAEDQIARSRLEQAELMLADLERQSPADPRLLSILERVYLQTGRMDQWYSRMESLLGQSQQIGPLGMTDVATRLAAMYLDVSRPADASRVLDLARSVVGHGEPDLQVRLASVYRQAGGEGVAERLLGSVLEVDPLNTTAAAELSSIWADQGKHLDRAERLARQAADRDPSDPLARGNVGWVLYRAGRLGAARDELLTAISLSTEPAVATGPATIKNERTDPVLLDRAGDVLYRLGEREKAAGYWERAQRRLGDQDIANADRAQVKSLRLTLPKKLQQHRTGQDVEVAAIASIRTVP